MKADGNCIYFSSCAIHPDGIVDPFLLMELPWLKDRFKNVFIISQNYRMKALATDSNSFADYDAHSLHLPVRFWFMVPFQKDFWHEVIHLSSLKAVLKLFAFTARGLKMAALAEKTIHANLSSNDSLTLYSCWMSYDGYAACICKQKHPESKCVIRGHAFDIDKDRNPMNPFLMKRMIAATADSLHFISKIAKEQFLQYASHWNISEEKLRITHFGSQGEIIPPRTDLPCLSNKFLRMISVAQVLPIKQVDMIAEALRNWDGIPIQWIHVGGGKGLSSLRLLMEDISDHNEKLICSCLGELTSQQIDELYRCFDFDLFINCSKKEGIPVSIMEAMRYSIPVIAPKIGGIPEIVTSETGICYHPEEKDALLHAIQRFIELSPEEVSGKRAKAWQSWQENFQNRTQLPRLFDAIS